MGVDSLQKSAQKSEMHPSNTKPKFFSSLTIFQTLIVLLISTQLSPVFQRAAYLSYGSHWFGFIFSILINSDKWFDVTEDISYLFILIHTYYSINEPVTLRQKTAFSLAILWCVRLTLFLAYRIIIRGRDFRFDNLIKEPFYNCFGWTSGGTWCFINGFCLWELASSKTEISMSSFGFADYLGIIVFVIGFLLESIADIQKYRFNIASKSGKNLKWIDTGMIDKYTIMLKLSV